MFLKVVFTYTYFGLVPCSLPSTGMFTFKFVEYFIFLTVYTKIFLLARNGHIHPTARIITIIYLTYVARIISFILFCITFTMKISRVFKSCILRSIHISSLYIVSKPPPPPLTDVIIYISVYVVCHPYYSSL